MMRILRKVGFSLGILVVPTFGFPQQDVGNEPLDIDPNTFFVLGNLEYILLHELAHVLIGDLSIPIIGPEENAADYIATATLIRADLFDAARAQRAHEFLLATANGLATSWEFTLESGSEVQYWDSHSLTIQRFYQMICLIYGSNPELFAALPSRVGMPEHRSARCASEFDKANQSLQWLLENFGRRPDDPPGAEVEIVYERVPTQASQRVVDGVRASGMLDNTIARLRTRFALPAPLRIIFRRCSQPQAAWFAQQRELVVCYELLDNYYALGLTERSAVRRTLLEASN